MSVFASLHNAPVVVEASTRLVSRLGLQTREWPPCSLQSLYGYVLQKRPGPALNRLLGRHFLEKSHLARLVVSDGKPGECRRYLQIAMMGELFQRQKKVER